MTPHANAHSAITKMLAITSWRPGSQSPRERYAAVAALTTKYATSHATHGRIQDATPKMGFFRLRGRFATSVAQNPVTPSSNETKLSHGSGRRKWQPLAARWLRSTSNACTGEPLAGALG